jgi:hypothetical protein
MPQRPPALKEILSGRGGSKQALILLSRLATVADGVG